MKTISQMMLVLSAAWLAAAPAMAGEQYELTISNGSGMPISPGALYLANGQQSMTEIGSAPSAGFVELCTTGNNAGILSELAANKSVLQSVATPGLIQPGKSAQVTIQANVTDASSLHFVAMYGETKDSCSVIDLAGARVRAAGIHAIQGTDHVVATGAFTDPVVGADSDSGCSGAADAVSCLRTLEQSNASPAIRYFPGYLPSVLNYLEDKFGSAEVLPLLLQGGSVRFQLMRTH